MRFQKLCANPISASLMASLNTHKAINGNLGALACLLNVMEQVDSSCHEPQALKISSTEELTEYWIRIMWTGHSHSIFHCEDLESTKNEGVKYCHSGSNGDARAQELSPSTGHGFLQVIMMHFQDF